MDIKYIGHSSFKLNFKSASVITDPYEPSVGFKFPNESATIVTISHQHNDHNNHAAITETKKVVSGPGEYEIEGISIIGIDSFHDDKKGAERGRNVIYIFEAEGVRIAHLGDLGHKLSEKQLELMGDIDLLMIPVGGLYTIDAKTAVEIVHSIEPEFIIPMHFKTKHHDEKTFAELTEVDVFVKELGIKQTETKKFTLKASDLTGEDQTVILLERS